VVESAAGHHIACIFFTAAAATKSSSPPLAAAAEPVSEQSAVSIEIDVSIQDAKPIEDEILSDTQQR
jgi:hypothetical protein